MKRTIYRLNEQKYLEECTSDDPRVWWLPKRQPDQTVVEYQTAAEPHNWPADLKAKIRANLKAAGRLDSQVEQTDLDAVFAPPAKEA